ncbi:hypothetical protein [Yersinia enterocolitica]|uniref:hypothetical protein n=1 Tax=Yersinia enterocolitica TaxID=630 RepID=UPI003F481EE0
MPPDIIASYTKDLTIEPLGTKELIETFNFFTREGGLFRADEFLVTGGDYNYYLDVYSVACTTPGYYIEHGSDLLDQNIHQQDITNTLLELGMEDELLTKRIGRVAYRDFNFNESDGTVVTAKQIKSAKIDTDFRGAGLASNIYKMLTEKHDYLVCDNTQSIAGGSLWASSILAIAEVRIYDTQKGIFIDVLGRWGLGVNGIVPWSCQSLTTEQIIDWGRHHNSDVCHHIVNIISRDSLYDIE